MNNRIWVSMVFIACSFHVLAGDTEKANEDAKAFAHGINETKIKGISDDIDPSVMVPRYEGTDVPEVKYGELGVEIEDKAEVESLTDTTAQFIKTSRETRPDVVIDPNTDPMFLHYKEVSEQAHSLSETYSGCVDIPVGDKHLSSSVEKSCHVSGSYEVVNPECHLKYEPVCKDDHGGHPSFSENVTVKLGSKGRDFFTAKVDLAAGTWIELAPSDGIAKVVHIKPVDLDKVCSVYDTSINYKGVTHWGSAPSFVGGGPLDTTVWYRVLQHPTCKNKLQGIYQIEDKKKGPSTNAVLGGVFTYKFDYVGKCEIEIAENYTCDIGKEYPEEFLISKTCLSSGIRIIDGVEVFRECWDTKEVYKLESFVRIESDACQALRDDGCGYSRQVCLSLSPEHHCLDAEYFYSCPEKLESRSVAMCGSQLVCPDGNCTSEYGQSYAPATKDFKKAAASMAVAEEVSKSLDMDTLTLFTGSDEKCRRDFSGYIDCCKDGGWGVDLGLDRCSSDEKKLALAKEAGRTVKVGNYSSGGIFDKRRYKVYCIYPSKISRIIIQQGKAQLGLNFGTAREPVCTGFDLTQLELLDFDAMDFSEFYSDVMAEAESGSTPSAGSVAADIRAKLRVKFPDLGSE